jgi:CRP-like cAMP-binding protein
MKFEDQEYIYKEEDYAKEMYFIADGELDMFFTAPTTHVEVPFNQLPCSYYFGETDILFSEGKHREFGVKTTSKCHLLLLDHLDFENLLKKFEEESLEIMTLAHERNKRLLEKKDLALQAYEQQLDYKKLKSMPSEKMPELLKLSDVIGQSRSNSLISDNAEENDLKFLSTGEEPVLLNNHSACEDHSNKKVEDEKIINSKNLYKAVIEDKLVKEEDNLKVAKKKISNIEKDVQECMRILKNITDFFADINDDMSSLKVSANYNRLKSSN